MNNTEINTSRTTTVHTPGQSTIQSTTKHSEVVTAPHRSAAIIALAVVGFIALVGASMWLAIYSTRFIPSIVNGIGGAAVYIGSVFNPSSVGPTITVVPTPTASTTISFGSSTTSTSTTTITTATTTTSTVAASKTNPAPTTSGTATSNTYQVGGTSTTIAPHGLSDLAVTVTAVGYLTTTSTDSFVASTTVTSGNRPAVKFTIKNIGTNWTGTWRFNASIPTRTAYTFVSDPQQSLAPGASIDYTLGFDQVNTGTGQQVTIIANFDHTFNESNTTNNTATAYINVI